MKRTHTNWHEAITCAIQIDLKDYSHLLEFQTEHFLSQNKNRIDLLIIRKQADIHISKHIASIFRTHNIFEYKGLGSSLSQDAYYKTNGHAGYYINSHAGHNSIDRRDITLTFPAFHYPKNLFKHLTKDCHKTIANPFPGVYYIEKEMYLTQILVISELSPEDSLYLHCLNQHLSDLKLVDTLAKDYEQNKNNKIYSTYMNQFLGSHTKGDPIMVCENLFRLYGTSSEEIAENATQKAREQDKQFYQPQIDKLTNTVDDLVSKNNLLISELHRAKQLLAQNNIAY